MNQEQIKAKLDSMKKTRKTLKMVTLVASVIAMVMLVAYNFLSIAYLKSPVGTDYEQGFAFPGWQLIFYGFGRQFIMQDHLFDPNPITIIGMLGSFLVVLILTIRYERGKNKQKAIKEFVMAAFLLYSSIVLGACIIPVATTAATSGGVYDFLNQYLLNPNASFTAMPAAWITFAVLLVCACVKVCNGAFLLYQKSFAAKYAPKKKKGEE